MCVFALAEHLVTSEELAESTEPADMLSREVTNALATISRFTVKEEFAFSLMPIDTNRVKQGSLLAAASGPIDREAFKAFVGSVWKKLYHFSQSDGSNGIDSFRACIFKLVVDRTEEQLKHFPSNDILDDEFLKMNDDGACDALQSLQDCLKQDVLDYEELWQAISQLDVTAKFSKHDPDNIDSGMSIRYQ